MERSQKTEKKNTNYITIVDDTYTIVHDGEYNNEYGQPDTSTSHHILGFKIDKYYTDLKVDFEIDPNKTYYLVYVIYNTGDSFHREDGRISYVHLHQNLDAAVENVKRIENNGENVDRIEFVNDDGGTWKEMVPWVGYFEEIAMADFIPVKLIR